MQKYKKTRIRLPIKDIFYIFVRVLLNNLKH